MNHHSYGKGSLAKLDTCDRRLRKIAVQALILSPYDITIVHGWRGKDVQNALFASGVSKAKWGQSPHNAVNDEGLPCSVAIDFAPYVTDHIPWDDTHIFACIAGVFMTVAQEMGHSLRWGGDWDNDGSSKDQTLLDWGHLELWG